MGLGERANDMTTAKYEAAVAQAVQKAIAKMGLPAFKKTSFFMSSHVLSELKRAA